MQRLSSHIRLLHLLYMYYRPSHDVLLGTP